MTNWFEQYYPDLIKFAKFCIRERKIPVQPEDLVNDAYIKFFDTGDEFDLKKVKDIIYKESFKEVAHKMSQNLFSDGFALKSKIRGDRVCTMCKEVKPVGAFRLAKLQGYYYVFNQCKECLNSWNIQWFKDNKELWNTYCRKWQSKKKGYEVLPWDEYVKKKRLSAKPIGQAQVDAVKKYCQKRAGSLTDSYIIQVLKQRNKPFTPNDIEKKRQELFEKRRRKLIKAA